jgi:cupin 2 domain-containing protein
VPSIDVQNLFDGVPLSAEEEIFTQLVTVPGLRIERIVSTGQASPEGSWFDQEWNEWVIVLAGQAELVFEDETEALRLAPGDHLLIPAHRRHRVLWTDPMQPTVWLAVHFEPRASS